MKKEIITITIIVTTILGSLTIADKVFSEAESISPDTDRVGCTASDYEKMAGYEEMVNDAISRSDHPNRQFVYYKYNGLSEMMLAFCKSDDATPENKKKAFSSIDKALTQILADLDK